MTPVWKRRQQRAYEMMWREHERKRRRDQLIAGPFGWIVEVPRVLTSWQFAIALIAVFSLMLIARARAAQVPQACIELAATFGKKLPSTLGRLGYERAKSELKQLSDDDPAVKKCRTELAKLEGKK